MVPITPASGPATPGEANVAVVTKNRIGNALAVVAAVIGLVLVFSGAGHGDDALLNAVNEHALHRVYVLQDARHQVARGPVVEPMER